MQSSLLIETAKNLCARIREQQAQTDASSAYYTAQGFLQRLESLESNSHALTFSEKSQLEGYISRAKSLVQSMRPF